MKRNSKGFTLIELLIVVAIIGIIVAIAIPNLLNAIQRAKQRRTMGDMRTVATAIEAYSVDLNRYPPAAGFSMPTGVAIGTTTLSNAEGYISPTYLRKVPLVDGWGSYFLFSANTVGTDYMLCSYAKNGTVDTFVYGPTTSFNADILYVDGQFVQYPEGVQN
jgi:general secretion pathway protein G